jgi:Protein of unknown function (DUF3307)
MEILTRTVLTLLLGHLLTDFVFQTDALLRRKKSGRTAGYVQHGAIYFACAVVLTGFFVPAVVYAWRFVAVVAGLTLVHLAIDGSKIRLARRTPLAEGTAAFVADQVAHFVSLVVAACWIARVRPAGILLDGLHRLQTPSNRVLLALVVYVGVIFGGGYLIRFMTRALLKHLQAGEARAELSNAGMYIGWLERFLVMTALFLHSPATAGLILAAKSIARYPEFKREQFAEYFLIGTLLSISLATVGGVILLKAFYGSSALLQ